MLKLTKDVQIKHADRTNYLDLKTLLYVMHEFFGFLQSVGMDQKNNDNSEVPLRSVKTVLVYLCKTIGDEFQIFLDRCLDELNDDIFQFFKSYTDKGENQGNDSNSSSGQNNHKIDLESIFFEIINQGTVSTILEKVVGLKGQYSISDKRLKDILDNIEIDPTTKNFLFKHLNLYENELQIPEFAMLDSHTNVFNRPLNSRLKLLQNKLNNLRDSTNALDAEIDEEPASISSIQNLADRLKKIQSQ
eukprot:NODE_17_length_48642_cov_1.199349.p25 type:complete len:246 gc:universal NODE_17_length_48642_cov_1.199349:30401-31138(+)